jgi:non-ribosomal peptide synthase protein (TIGR01720 family)
VRQAFRELPRAQILFNHLGQLNEPDEVPRSEMLAAAPESIGPTHSSEGVRYYPIAVSSWISDGKLYANLVYSSNLHDRATVKAFADEFSRQLVAAILESVACRRACRTQSAREDAEKP